MKKVDTFGGLWNKDCMTDVQNRIVHLSVKGSLRASPTSSVELNVPVELNYWHQKMNSIQREISTVWKQ